MVDSALVLEVLNEKTEEEIKGIRGQRPKRPKSNVIKNVSKRMIRLVIEAYANGDNLKTIKKTVKNLNGKKLTFRQIADIIDIRAQYILDNYPEDVVEPE
jgi:hypothetical protein